MAHGTELVDYLNLPPEQRLLLAQELIHSVVAEAQTPLTAEQLAEIDRRCADIDSGKIECLPWNDVRRGFLRGFSRNR